MGDPLSITASILAILGAGGEVGKGLKKLQALKRAPDILLDLNNEVADLHHIVQTANEILQQHTSINGSSSDRVCQSLERIKQTLSSYEKVISYDLTIIEGVGNHSRLDKSMWLQIEPKVKRLKSQVQTDKADLCLAWSLLTQYLSPLPNLCHS